MRIVFFAGRSSTGDDQNQLDTFGEIFFIRIEGIVDGGLNLIIRARSTKPLTVRYWSVSALEGHFDRVFSETHMWVGVLEKTIISASAEPTWWARAFCFPGLAILRQKLLEFARERGFRRRNEEKWGWLLRESRSPDSKSIAPVRNTCLVQEAQSGGYMQKMRRRGVELRPLRETGRKLRSLNDCASIAGWKWSVTNVPIDRQYLVKLVLNPTREILEGQSSFQPESSYSLRRTTNRDITICRTLCGGLKRRIQDGIMIMNEQACAGSPRLISGSKRTGENARMPQDLTK